MEPAAKKKKNEENETVGEGNFVWTDSEIELLLSVVTVQLQNSMPHQRTLYVAATGCGKYMYNNLNDTVR